MMMKKVEPLGTRKKFAENLMLCENLARAEGPPGSSVGRGGPGGPGPPHRGSRAPLQKEKGENSDEN